jgi:chemotaxis protein histidine kinase CheA
VTAMRSGRLVLVTALLVLICLLLGSCYTIQAPAGKKKKKKAESQAAVSKELQALIVDYVEEAMYTYPQVATRVGMHVYTLPSGEKIDLDRELPNYSDAVVDARIEALEAYLERLDKKVPKDALSLNYLADRRLLKDAIRSELYQLSVLKAHTRNPTVHVAALAEAVYYPLVVEYAPEAERLGDVMGRMHWIPSYVDRAIRMVKHSSAVYTEASVEINKWTLGLIRDELADRIEAVGDDELSAAYAGMKKPVIESLQKLQGFLEDDLPKKSKRTWRLGDEHYERQFALAFHGLAKPADAVADAREQIKDIRLQIFDLTKPVYCENNESDEKICGPSKAKIAAAKKAEEERLRKEEAKQAAEEKKKQKAEEKQAAEEERKRKAEEKKQAAEEKKKQKAEEKAKKAEEKKKKAEEKKKKSEEKKKKKSGEDEGITNPYEDKKKPKKKEEDEGGTVNPYGFLLLPPPDVAGAKVAGIDDDDEKEDEEAETEDVPGLDNIGGVKTEDATEGMIDRVVSWSVGFAAKEAGNGGGALPRVKEFLPEAAELARSADILSTVKSSGVSVAEMPACVSALGLFVELVPQPVFQPDLDGHLFVAAEDDADDLDDARLMLLTAVSAVPGQFEAYRRAVGIEMQTRRAVRVIYADQAFVRGWALYAATKVAEGDDSLAMRITSLAHVITAAVDLIVDVELHSGGLSEKEATKMLVDRGLLDKDEAAAHARRSKIAPTVNAAPFLGYRAWFAARGKVKKKLKKGFSAKGFHGDALDLGPVPLGQLGEILTSDDPNAVPDHEVVVDEPDEATTFSFIDAF